MTGDITARRPSDDILVSELPDGESVIRDLNTELYFGVNEFGTAIWAALAEGGDLEALAAATASATGEPVENVRADVAELVADLVKRGLVVGD